MEEEPFDFEHPNPEYCWTPLHDEHPKYGFTKDDLLGCLSDMATRDTQLCTTAVEHLFMICPCFLPPPIKPVAGDRRSDSDGEKAALESLMRLSASISDSRLRRAGKKGKKRKAVETVDDEGGTSTTVGTSYMDDID